MLILSHPTLHVNFFLANSTKQRSVIDKTVAKLLAGSPCGVGDLWCLETRLADVIGGALDAL